MRFNLWFWFLVAATAAWAALDLYGPPSPGRVSGLLSGALANYHPDRLFTAPVKCGEWFLYLHPFSGGKGKHGGFATCPYCDVISVTRTPPDDPAVTSVTVFWSYGNPTTHISYPYKSVAGRETFLRSQLRPVPSGMVFGHKVRDRLCLPYRPFSLKCDGRSAWCRKT